MAENKQLDREENELETGDEQNQTETETSEEIEQTEEQEEIINETEQKINQLKLEKEEQYDRMLRLQAEFDNYKRRSQKERAAERKYKSQDLANELLPVLDNFERALQVESNDATSSIIEGITMVYQQFLAALESQGIEEIKAVGEQFDPNLHHAVMQVEDDEFESNEVVEELQKGYMLADRVLRPSMVKVNK